MVSLIRETFSFDLAARDTNTLHLNYTFVKLQQSYDPQTLIVIHASDRVSTLFKCYRVTRSDFIGISFHKFSSLSIYLYIYHLFISFLLWGRGRRVRWGSQCLRYWNTLSVLTLARCQRQLFSLPSFLYILSLPLRRLRGSRLASFTLIFFISCWFCFLFNIYAFPLLFCLRCMFNVGYFVVASNLLLSDNIWLTILSGQIYLHNYLLLFVGFI